MPCKNCGSEVDKKTEKCIRCGTDNHNYTTDWMKATEQAILWAV